MIKFIMLDKPGNFERAIIYALVMLMVFVVALSTIRLGWKIFEELMKPPFLFLHLDKLFVVL